MTKHEVKLRTHGTIEVGYGDFEFEVLEDCAKLGTLKVSKGSVDWLPRDKKTTHYKMEWADLAKLIQAHGKQVSRRGRPK